MYVRKYILWPKLGGINWFTIYGVHKFLGTHRLRDGHTRKQYVVFGGGRRYNILD